MSEFFFPTVLECWNRCTVFNPCVRHSETMRLINAELEIDFVVPDTLLLRVLQNFAQEEYLDYIRNRRKCPVILWLPLHGMTFLCSVIPFDLETVHSKLVAWDIKSKRKLQNKCSNRNLNWQTPPGWMFSGSRVSQVPHRLENALISKYWAKSSCSIISFEICLLVVESSTFGGPADSEVLLQSVQV